MSQSSLEGVLTSELQAYQEDMPYSGFEGFGWVNQASHANDYVRKHNPPVLYNKNTEDTNRLAQIKNLTMFQKDLVENKLPQWMFITPSTVAPLRSNFS